MTAAAVAAIGLAVTGCTGTVTAGTLSRDQTPSLSTASVTGAPSPTESRSVAAEPGRTTFVCSGDTWGLLLQWTNQGGGLTGTFQDSSMSGTAPAETVSTNSGTLSGSLTGTAITLSLGDSSQPLSGDLTGGTLSLNVAQSDGSFQADTCTQSTLSDWNALVASLDSTSNQDDSQARQASAQVSAQAQRQQNVRDAQSSLASDVATLSSDSANLNNDTTLAGTIQTAKSDYDTEQTGFATEKADSCEQMGSDASQVGSDASQVGDDLDELSDDSSALQGTSGIQGIKSDISAVQSDLSTLQSLGVSPGTPSSSALAGGAKAIKNADAAIAWARQQGKAINGEAQHLSTTAQNYAASHCPNG